LQKVPYRCGLEVKNRRFDLRRFLHTLYSKALWSMKVWATHGGSTSSNPSSLKMTDICIGLKKRGEQKMPFPQAAIASGRNATTPHYSSSPPSARPADAR